MSWYFLLKTEALNIKGKSFFGIARNVYPSKTLYIECIQIIQEFKIFYLRKVICWKDYAYTRICQYLMHRVLLK